MLHGIWLLLYDVYRVYVSLQSYKPQLTTDDTDLFLDVLIPEYYEGQLHHDALQGLLPEWHGELAVLEQFHSLMKIFFLLHLYVSAYLIH